MRGRTLTFLIALACLCAPAVARAQEGVSDPFEGFNRRMYAVHDAVDHAVLEPVARGYRAVTPQPVRTGVTNFLRNLQSPVIFANDLLQGQAKRATVTFARFGLNSTIGLLGILDPAESVGLERHDEDFGQTLAVWGVGSGPYLFIPVLGPTNLRDGAGRIVDVALDPLHWAEFDGDSATRVTRAVATGVTTREDLIEEVETLRETSFDPYVTIRSTYGLLRHSAIENGVAETLPTFEEVPPEDMPPGTEQLTDPTAPPADTPPDSAPVQTPEPNQTPQTVQPAPAGDAALQTDHGVIQ